MSPLKIVRVSHEEDVFAAEETKVHTLSHQAISEMLDTAAKQEALTSSPPPPESGVRGLAAKGSRPAATKSGMMPKIPAAGRVPVIAGDEGDDDDAPTRLSERVSLPRQVLVTQLMTDPPVIITSAPTPATPIVVVPEPSANDAMKDCMHFVAPPVREGIDKKALAITIATFVCTLLPGLVLLHHFLTR